MKPDNKQTVDPDPECSLYSQRFPQCRWKAFKYKHELLWFLSLDQDLLSVQTLFNKFIYMFSWILLGGLKACHLWDANKKIVSWVLKECLCCGHCICCLCCRWREPKDSSEGLAKYKERQQLDRPLVVGCRTAQKISLLYICILVRSQTKRLNL